MAIDKDINTRDDKVTIRKNLKTSEKMAIAKYASSLIKPYDFIYLDAGTTTEIMIDFIKEKNAVFITNGIAHAKKLIEKECKTYILGGEVKWITEAIVGVEAINSLKKYNFTKGFFGANGISENRGYTTPDIKEALVKEEALNRTKDAYILADESKFDEISSVIFADIENAKIITTKLSNDKYKELTEVMEVSKL